MQKFDQKPQPLALPLGQSHHATLPRGTVIHVMTGEISVITRIWLDNSLLTVHVPVRAGGIYCVAASGDFEFLAVKAARVLQHRPPNLLGPLSWPGFLKKSAPDRSREFQPGLLNNAARA